MTFAPLGLAAPVLRAVEAAGYSTPTPIQEQAIPPLLAGRDVLGCAQTGTGKTAAFALPILHRLLGADLPPRGTRRRIRTLVLSPTRELAAQIRESFQTYGRFTQLRHTMIFGGVGQHPQVQALRSGVDIVVATPGRLLDLMQQGHVDLSSVEMFVLDEADRMFDMGFLPDLRRIIAKLPRERQTLLFSATMPPAIQELANSTLRDPVRIRLAPVKATTELIEQSVCHVPKKEKPTVLIGKLQKLPVSRAIVFTRTKHGADRVVKLLEQAGIRSAAIHGNKSQSARQRALAAFKSKRPPVLVATDLAARGIDVDDVSHVFNFDLPLEAETYVHRIGRTGRAGATGTAIAFCDFDERRYLRAIEQLLRKPVPVDPEFAPANMPKHVPAAPSQNGHHKKGGRPNNRPPRPHYAGQGANGGGGQKGGKHRAGKSQNRYQTVSKRRAAAATGAAT